MLMLITYILYDSYASYITYQPFVGYEAQTVKSVYISDARSSKMNVMMSASKIPRKAAHIDWICSAVGVLWGTCHTHDM